VKAGGIIGVHLVDSIVWTTDGRYVSLREEQPDELRV
jgi:hypothetical protein